MVSLESLLDTSTIIREVNEFSTLELTRNFSDSAGVTATISVSPLGGKLSEELITELFTLLSSWLSRQRERHSYWTSSQITDTLQGTLNATRGYPSLNGGGAS